jgi:hypothetical protein
MPQRCFPYVTSDNTDPAGYHSSGLVVTAHRSSSTRLSARRLQVATDLVTFSTPRAIESLIAPSQPLWTESWRIQKIATP